MADAWDVDALRELAEEAVRAGGALLLERFGARVPAREKSSPRDVVSEADVVAERVVVECLRGTRPADAVVGEELGALDGRSGLRWGVDALDGTSNYVAGIPHWATAVGCEDADGSVVAAVFDPTRDELFSAARGSGATLNGRRVVGSRDTPLGWAIAAFGPSWVPQWHDHRVALSDRFLRSVAHGRQMGSFALDLAWTAAGRFDVFYYETALEPWDLALRVLAEEAGLRTETRAATETTPGAVVACPPTLRAEVDDVLDVR